MIPIFRRSAPRFPRCAIRWLAGGLLLLLAAWGCSAWSHTTDIMQVRAGLGGDRPGQSLAALEENALEHGDRGNRPVRPDADLAVILELGTAYHYLGRFDESNRVMESAFRRYSAQEERARVSIGQISRHLGEAAITEGLGEYQMADYEKVLLHSIKAMNYLLAGNAAEARVEIERAYIRQKLIRERADWEASEIRDSFDREIQSANQQIRAQGKDKGSRPVDLKSAFDPTRLSLRAALSQSEREMTREVRSSRENAFTEALSAVVFGLNREWSNALPPLRRALEITANPYIERERSTRESASSANGQGSNLFLFVYQGYAPAKYDFPLSFFNPVTGAMNQISIARPRRFPGFEATVEVRARSRPPERAEPLSTLSALALKAYDDNLPLTTAKSLIRLVAQSVKDYQMVKEFGQAGALTASLLNAAVERADVRAWSLLPDRVLFYSARTDAGMVSVEARNAGNPALLKQDIPVPPGGQTVAVLRIFDRRASLYYHEFP